MVRLRLKLKWFYTSSQLVQLYKTHVLSVFEFPTPAVYHATDSALEYLDKVERHFLRELGLTAEQALQNYRLAPLNTRRDVALLGLVNRTLLVEGPPPHFKKWFFPQVRPRHQYLTILQVGKHNKQLHDWLDGDHTELIRRSPLGLTRMHNQLPRTIVDEKCVSNFQRTATTSDSCR